MYYSVIYSRSVNAVCLNGDTPMNRRNSGGSAVICHANHAAFAANQVIINRCVESRMSLWCKGGTGTVTVNGRRFTFHPGDYLFLPWKHRVEYRPDPRTPFLVAGIHIVPQHDLDKPTEFTVSHSCAHHLAGCPWRRDADLSPLRDIVTFRLNAESPLWLLSEYIVRLYQTGSRIEAVMRQLASALITELIRTQKSMPAGNDHRSAADFAALTEYLNINIATPIAIVSLARHIDRSESTVGRLIRKQTGLSAVNWINQTRIQRARTLLSTTRLTVAETGRRVGIPDQFYFSKLFKKWTGEPPLAYRKHTPML